MRRWVWDSETRPRPVAILSTNNGFWRNLPLKHVWRYKGIVLRRTATRNLGKGVSLLVILAFQSDNKAHQSIR